MKKITLLISSLGGGGAEGVCVSIANALVERGWSVDLVVLTLNNESYANRLDERVNLVALNVTHARYAPIHLLRYLKENDVEKILIFNYELTVITIILRILFRLRVKIIARNINTISKICDSSSGLWQSYFVKPLIKKFYSKVDHVVNQCHAMRNDLLSVFPQLDLRSSVIYNPVAKHVELYSKNLSLNYNKENYILCVGRLEKQKAFHHSIDVFSRVQLIYPDLRLKIVGIGSLENELKALADKLGVANKVDFEGFRENMIPYYLGAKLTLLTSLYEGFPNVLIESITLGTPVVAFDCQSGPNEIINNCNGILVDNGNVEKLEYAINMVLKGAINSSSIIESAEKYKIDFIVNDWENLIVNVQ